MDCVTVPTTATSLFRNRPGSALISPIFTRSHATDANPTTNNAMKKATFLIVIIFSLTCCGSRGHKQGRQHLPIMHRHPHPFYRLLLLRLQRQRLRYLRRSASRAPRIVSCPLSKQAQRLGPVERRKRSSAERGGYDEPLERAIGQGQAP